MASIGSIGAKVMAKTVSRPQYRLWNDLEKRLDTLEAKPGGSGDMPLMVVEDEWEGSGNITKTFTTAVMGLSIRNKGTSMLTVTIGDKTIEVDAGESFENLFKPFTSVIINATGLYKALVTAPYNGTVTPAPTDTTAPTLTISPAAGTFTTAQTVTITSNETATIYYTLDGSTPTTSSSIYPGPLTINASLTLKYFAKDTAGNTSAIQTANYVINASQADITAPVITASPAAGTFTNVQTVTLSSNETATIYYTLDGSTPTTSSAVYSSPISVSSTLTIRYFGRDTAGNVSSVQSAGYTINLPDTTPPIVTISPAAGSYSGAQSVTLSANEAATIYYTLDGSTPTTASLAYSSTISIPASTTIKYFARDTAGNASAVQTAVYTINLSDTTAPNNVASISTSNISTTSVTLTWPASTSPDVAGYDLYNSSTFIASTTATSYTVTGLSASTSYTFTVKAKDTSNNIASGTSVTVNTATAGTINEAMTTWVGGLS